MRVIYMEVCVFGYYLNEDDMIFLVLYYLFRDKFFLSNVVFKIEFTKIKEYRYYDIYKY